MRASEIELTGPPPKENVSCSLFTPLERRLPVISIQIQMIYGDFDVFASICRGDATNSAPTALHSPVSITTLSASEALQKENIESACVNREDPTSETHSYDLLRTVLRDFLYGAADSKGTPCLTLKEKELNFLKMFLKKKIMRTQKKSCLKMVDNMDSWNFHQLLSTIVPKRRKSVMKGVIFRLFWKFASLNCNLLTTFFNDDRSFNYQSNKVNNNLQDEYYKKCLKVPEFKAHFFTVIKSQNFFEFCLSKSKSKFDRKFKQWISVFEKSLDLMSLLSNIQIPLTRVEIEKSEQTFADLAD